MSRRALRIAIDATKLPVEERGLLIDALLGLDGRFERAVMELGQIEGLNEDRPLSAILADIESGVPLSTDESVLLQRVAAQLAPHSSVEFSDVWHEMIRATVREFGPTGSTLSQAEWLRERFDRYVAGAEWRNARLAILPPHIDPMRVMLWRLAKFGPLPRDRKLREILSGE